MQSIVDDAQKHGATAVVMESDGWLWIQFDKAPPNWIDDDVQPDLILPVDS